MTTRHFHSAESWLCRIALLVALGIGAVRHVQAAPPGEALNLRWCPGTKTCLAWDPASPSGQYRVHRGSASTLSALTSSVADSCRSGTFANTSTGNTLGDTPAPGGLMWYLVVPSNCAGDGPAGNGSSGPRVVDATGDCGPTTCADGIRNGQESGIDCGGGSCGPCAGGGSCCAAVSCGSAICMMAASQGTCAALTCTNGVADATETDIDCGGGGCPACATNQVCAAASDCQSGVCGATHHCAAPTCADGVLNGVETDIDCGGSVCGSCLDGDTCTVDSDCRSGRCPGGSCLTAICTPATLAFSSDSSLLTVCGSTNNTYWTYDTSTASATTALDPSGDWVYSAVPNRLYKHPAAGGSPIFHDFTGVTPQQPAAYIPKLGENVVTFGTSAGFVTQVTSSALDIVWSRNLRRPTCSTDTIGAPIVVQRWAASDANYQALRTQDLVMAGTNHACTGMSVNRVYGLDGSTGNILWTFNNTGATPMDTVNGLVLDTTRNMLFAVTEKIDPLSIRSTVWAFRTATGTRTWSIDHGSIRTRPVLANGGLYVVNRDGVLYKLDPATSATLWQLTVATPPTEVTALTTDASQGRIYTVDTAGFLKAWGDVCSGAAPVWSTNLGGQNAVGTPAAVGDYVYVMSQSGRLYQVIAATGTAPAYATIAAGAGTPTEPIPRLSPVNRVVAGHRGVLRSLCIPWPDTAGDKALLERGPWDASDRLAIAEVLRSVLGIE